MQNVNFVKKKVAQICKYKFCIKLAFVPLAGDSNSQILQMLKRTITFEQISPGSSIFSFHQLVLNSLH